MSLSPASHLLTSNHVPINRSAQSNTDAEKSLKRGHLFTDFQLQITSTSNHSAQSDTEAEKSVKRGHFSPTFHFRSHPRQITQLIQTLKQKSQWKGANFHRFSTSSHIHVKSLSSIRYYWSREVFKKGPLFTDFQLQITSKSNHSAQSHTEAEKSDKSKK